MANKPVSIWGVGPVLMITTVLYSILVAVINNHYPELFAMPVVILPALHVAAAILLVIGAIIFFLSFRTILMDFAKGVLFTEGVYNYARHPLYAAFIVFLVPGCMLLTSSWLFLTVPLFMALVFSMTINREEDNLERLFGDEYLEYKQKTPRLSFKFWRCWL